MRNNNFDGLKIQGPRDDYNDSYLEGLRDVMNDSVAEFPRTYAARIDLRLPNFRYDPYCLSRDEIVSYNRNYTRLMKCFIQSLGSKISAQSQRKLNHGIKRVHRNNIRYGWCRERSTSESDHYHLVLFFNKDRFHTLGNYRKRGSLASMIIEAWASALNMDFEDVYRLVHFPENHGYYLMDGKPEFSQQYQKLFHRLSYLAKKETKHYGEGRRNFGTSYR
ncbi:inovirus Gp2 family protein [Vibrio sp.]|uniref:inovirus Gp2 family protein n=1 Tax=Vibrio sp. TaxID=678 RepID=UPI003F6C1612